MLTSPGHNQLASVLCKTSTVSVAFLTQSFVYYIHTCSLSICLPACLPAYLYIAYARWCTCDKQVTFAGQKHVANLLKSISAVDTAETRSEMKKGERTDRFVYLQISVCADGVPELCDMWIWRGRNTSKIESHPCQFQAWFMVANLFKQLMFTLSLLESFTVLKYILRRVRTILYPKLRNPDITARIFSVALLILSVFHNLTLTPFRSLTTTN